MSLYSRGGNETLWAFPNFVGFAEIFELVQSGSFVIFSSPHLKLASALLILKDQTFSFFVSTKIVRHYGLLLVKCSSDL